MYIREATQADNDELQHLQALCLYGKSLVVSTVNTPDFFARARAYESWKVFAACENGRVIGSAACAVRPALINGRTLQVGYEFQYFTCPDYRRRGVAGQLHKHIEDYLVQRGAGLSYVLITQGNSPSRRLFERQGFTLHRTLVMSVVMVYRNMEIPPPAKIRPVAPSDLPAVAQLLNQTWAGHSLYEPASADSLAQFVERVPTYGLDNLLVIEDGGKIAACLGYWDWSQVTRVTVRALNTKLRVMGVLLDIARCLRPTPRMAKSGDVLRQWCLTPVAFKYPQHLAVLLGYVNNQARIRGIGQIFSVCEPNHVFLKSIRGFFRADVGLHLYVKALRQDAVLGTRPVFVDAIDL